MEKDYKKLCEQYEKRMGIGEFDPAIEGYLVYVNILQQQIEFLQQFKLKSKIVSEEKADMTTYKNAKDLWENLPTMIRNVKGLKIELKMEGEEVKKNYKPISAKEISLNGDV